MLPSEWYENAPISVLEAYASGKPVIGARIGGIPEMIREAETGTTFASGDVEELADCMQRFSAMNADAIGRMGAEGRRFVETTFTRDNYRDRMLGLYDGLMGVAA